MKSFYRVSVVLLMVLVLLTGCETYEIETPQEMIEVTRTNSNYVAMTHDGVVIRGRVIRQGEDSSVPRANQDFWVNATRERMRLSGGYALLDEDSVRSSNGHQGTRMEFGRDQDGRTYRYWVQIFVTEDYIHVLDAGGREERFEKAEGAVERALASYQVLK